MSAAAFAVRRQLPAFEKPQQNPHVGCLGPAALAAAPTLDFVGDAGRAGRNMASELDYKHSVDHGAAGRADGILGADERGPR
jgi:hypothetical protein